MSFDPGESRPEVERWLRERAAAAPQAPIRYELLDGDRVALTPVTEAHAACTTRLAGLLTGALGDQVVVSVQNPVRLDDHSQPCPDLAVLEPRTNGYEGAFATPDDIRLLIEVSDTTFSLTHDRGRKAAYYARCGIAECWIVDLMGGQVLVHRSPASGGYREIRNLRGGSSLTAKNLPGFRVAVSSILGREEG